MTGDARITAAYRASSAPAALLSDLRDACDGPDPQPCGVCRQCDEVMDNDQQEDER